MTNETQRLPHLKPKQVKEGMGLGHCGEDHFNPAKEDREGSAVCQLVRVGKGEN